MNTTKSFGLLLFVLFTLQGISQTGTSILFQTGAELEYKTMSARAKGFKTELYEVTRITLIVERVVDSGGATYSFILKKGRGIEHPERDHYERRMVVVKDEDKIIVPSDLYIVDTAYLADKYPAAKKAKGYTAVVKMPGVMYMRTGSETGKIEYLPRVVEPEFIIRDLVMTTPTGSKSVLDNYESLQEYNYKIKIAIGDMKFETGTSKVTTAAGTFDCYTMKSKAVLDGMGRKIEASSEVYFDPAIGIIKSEQVDAKVKSSAFELVRLKRP